MGGQSNVLETHPDATGRVCGGGGRARGTSAGRRTDPAGPIQPSPAPSQRRSRGRGAPALGSIKKTMAEPFLTLLTQDTGESS